MNSTNAIALRKERDGQERQSALIERTLRAKLEKGALVAAHFRMDAPSGETTVVAPQGGAFMAVVRLARFGKSNLWCDERHLSRPVQEAGSVAIYDLSKAWAAELHQPFNTVNFFVTQYELDQLAEEMGLRRLELRGFLPQEGQVDNTMMNMAAAILPMLNRPDEVNRVFVDHIGSAIKIHLVHKYGNLVPRSEVRRGGLTRTQERRVKEMLVSDLTNQIGLADLAQACELSRGHFVRSFKQTTGTSPHQWLLLQRVEHAKMMLLEQENGLSEIALACGFADQSHFTRMFSRTVGIAPGAWRRVRAS